MIGASSIRTISYQGSKWLNVDFAAAWLLDSAVNVADEHSEHPYAVEVADFTRRCALRLVEEFPPQEAHR